MAGNQLTMFLYALEIVSRNFKCNSMVTGENSQAAAVTLANVGNAHLVLVY